MSQAAVSTIETGSRPLRVDELVVLSRFLGQDASYFLAATTHRMGLVGVTLRAEVAALPATEYRHAVGAFLDDVERRPLPKRTVDIGATKPVPAAIELAARTGQNAPPTDLDAIAQQLGVGVFPRPLPDALSALIIRHGDGAVVGVNSSHSPERQRFSIAHELGHFVLHPNADHVVEFDPQSEGVPPHYNWGHEKAANEFAAELLMPAEEIRKDAHSLSISRLASRYQVSLTAIAFRLANLRLQAR